MTPLNSQQQQLLFDYALGLTSEQENTEAEDLLASSEEASGLYELFRSSIEPLDSVEPEACPDDLAENTVSLLLSQAKEAAATHADAGPTVVKIPFWRNWGEIATVAAALVLFVGVLLPTLSSARDKYYQTRCQAQLAGIHTGVADYAADHDGQLPTVAMAPGAPWWKVGYQGQENHSNTRRAWQLVRQGYVPLDQFTCPGRDESGQIATDAIKVDNYNDFPARAYIQYSTRLVCPQSSDAGSPATRVIFADRSPISEKLPSSYDQALRLKLSRNLLTANSTSHNERGQNVLMCDGSVHFVRERHTSFSDDDIYTLTDMSDGYEVTGCEVPSCETDAFLVQ